MKTTLLLVSMALLFIGPAHADCDSSRAAVKAASTASDSALMHFSRASRRYEEDVSSEAELIAVLTDSIAACRDVIRTSDALIRAYQRDDAENCNGNYRHSTTIEMAQEVNGKVLKIYETLTARRAKLIRQEK